jgi:hypothetical protein
MEKEDNGGADIYLTGNNPNQFHPEPIPGAATAPPKPLDGKIQTSRANIFAALGM